MAARVIRKRDVPEPSRGGNHVAGKPTVTLRKAGQIWFSKGSQQALGAGADRMLILFDEDNRELTLSAIDGVPKGLEEEDCFRLHRVKSSKAGQVYISAGCLMSWLSYDYKLSGDQVRDAVVDEQKRSVSFVLPEGSLPPREVRKRKQPGVRSYARAHGIPRKPMHRATAAESTASA